MGMADVGPELEGTHRRGDTERVLRVELTDEIERGGRDQARKKWFGGGICYLRKIGRNCEYLD